MEDNTPNQNQPTKFIVQSSAGYKILYASTLEKARLVAEKLLNAPCDVRPWNF